MADEPKKGDAAPLEGVLGQDIMMVLGIGFACMSLKMCANLALTAGMALEAPLLGPELASIAGPVNTATANTLSGGTMPGLTGPNLLSGPAFPTPKMGGGMFS